MFSYVFMKILEAHPGSYDRRMNAITGEVEAAKIRIAGAIAPGSRVLEIGSGTGALALRLARAGARVEGFDRNEGMIREARRRLHAARLEERVHVQVLDISGMDTFPDAHFDAVVSTLVFSELSLEARRYALVHIHRVLKPGGVLWIADEVVPEHRGARLRARILRAPLYLVTLLVTGRATHPIPDLVQEVEAAGLVCLRMERASGGAFALLEARRPEVES